MIRKSTILLVAAAAFVAIATSQATADDRVRFKGRGEGFFAPPPGPPFCCSALQAGKATKLGRFTQTVDAIFLDVFTDPDSGLFVVVLHQFVETTAADGDLIFSEGIVFQTLCVPFPGCLDSIDGEFAITGGTGRFQGATGDYTLTGTVDAAGLTEPPILFDFKGTISVADDDDDDDDGDDD